MFSNFRKLKIPKTHFKFRTIKLNLCEMFEAFLTWWWVVIFSWANSLCRWEWKIQRFLKHWILHCQLHNNTWRYQLLKLQFQHLFVFGRRPQALHFYFWVTVKLWHLKTMTRSQIQIFSVILLLCVFSLIAYSCHAVNRCQMMINSRWVLAVLHSLKSCPDYNYTPFYLALWSIYDLNAIHNQYFMVRTFLLSIYNSLNFYYIFKFKLEFALGGCGSFRNKIQLFCNNFFIKSDIKYLIRYKRIYQNHINKEKLMKKNNAVQICKTDPIKKIVRILKK